MDSERTNNHGMQDPASVLERAFIEEFVRLRGYDPVRLDELAEGQRTQLLKDASTYAASKLAELESKAHFIHEFHGEH